MNLNCKVSVYTLRNASDRKPNPPLFYRGRNFENFIEDLLFASRSLRQSTGVEQTRPKGDSSTRNMSELSLTKMPCFLVAVFAHSKLKLDDKFKSSRSLIDTEICRKLGMKGVEKRYACVLMTLSLTLFTVPQSEQPWDDRPSSLSFRRISSLFVRAFDTYLPTIVLSSA